MFYEVFSSIEKFDSNGTVRLSIPVVEAQITEELGELTRKGTIVLPRTGLKFSDNQNETINIETNLKRGDRLRFNLNYKLTRDVGGETIFVKKVRVRDDRIFVDFEGPMFELKSEKQNKLINVNKLDPNSGGDPANPLPSDLIVFIKQKMAELYPDTPIKQAPNFNLDVSEYNFTDVPITKVFKTLMDDFGVEFHFNRFKELVISNYFTSVSSLSYPSSVNHVLDFLFDVRKFTNPSGLGAFNTNTAQFLRFEEKPVVEHNLNFINPDNNNVKINFENKKKDGTTDKRVVLTGSGEITSSIDQKFINLSDSAFREKIDETIKQETKTGFMGSFVTKGPLSAAQKFVRLGDTIQFKNQLSSGILTGSDSVIATTRENRRYFITKITTNLHRKGITQGVEIDGSFIV
jgi:hypothetical protein